LRSRRSYVESPEWSSSQARWRSSPCRRSGSVLARLHRSGGGRSRRLRGARGLRRHRLHASRVRSRARKRHAGERSDGGAVRKARGLLARLWRLDEPLRHCTRQHGANAVAGGGLAATVGAALAFKLRHQPRVAVAFFGEGATNTGVFHESLNLAQLWQVPVVFVCAGRRRARARCSRSGGSTDRGGRRRSPSRTAPRPVFRRGSACNRVTQRGQIEYLRVTPPTREAFVGWPFFTRWAPTSRPRPDLPTRLDVTEASRSGAESMYAGGRTRERLHGGRSSHRPLTRR
jgi:hypothetical protein